MSLSLTLACLWAVAASGIAMFPSRHNHWPAAYALIALAVPLLGYVTLQHGLWMALLLAAAAGSILRWPLLYLARWLRRVATGRKRPGRKARAAASPQLALRGWSA